MGSLSLGALACRSLPIPVAATRLYARSHGPSQTSGNPVVPVSSNPLLSSIAAIGPPPGTLSLRVLVFTDGHHSEARSLGVSEISRRYWPQLLKLRPISNQR